MPDRHLRTVASLFGAILVASPLAGQTVRGRVAVLDIADAIPGAAVVLMSVDGRAHHATTSDSAGNFELAAREPGNYFVHAFAAGFREVRSDPLRLAVGRTVQVRINLRPVAVTIEGVTVYGLDRYGGFHSRRDLRQNYRFRSFDANDIERIGAANLKDVIRDVPLAGGRCFTFWLDGRRLESDRRFRRDWLVDWLLGEMEDAGTFPVTSFYGIEVFRNRGDAPREYTLGGSAHCGVVLVWTKVAGGR